MHKRETLEARFSRTFVNVFVTCKYSTGSGGRDL